MATSSGEGVRPATPAQAAQPTRCTLLYMSIGSCSMTSRTLWHNRPDVKSKQQSCFKGSPLFHSHLQGAAAVHKVAQLLVHIQCSCLPSTEQKQMQPSYQFKTRFHECAPPGRRRRAQSRAAARPQCAAARCSARPTSCSSAPASNKWVNFRISRHKGKARYDVHWQRCGAARFQLAPRAVLQRVLLRCGDPDWNQTSSKTCTCHPMQA